LIITEIMQYAGGVKMEAMVGLEVDWLRLAGSRLAGPLQPLHAQLFLNRPVFLPTEAEFLPPSEINLSQEKAVCSIYNY
jgi:hypothetical protein